jgi:selT/selW/selH-like putative selenoprotein
MIRSRGGVFEITWGNELLFSKKKSGRFPMRGEIAELVEKRQSQGGATDPE